MKRRLFVAGTISAALTACSPIGTALNGNANIRRMLNVVEPLNHALIGTRGLAQTYPESAISAMFPLDSLPTPMGLGYLNLLDAHFRSYRLRVDGAIDRPQSFSLSRLQAMRQTTQITRHDCIEGWSAIAKWSGVRLMDVLNIVQPRNDARYVVFHCMDVDDQGAPYYESLDLHRASHPQALLALGMNGQPIPVDYGAPVRLRVPTQLGYKSAKWVARIQVVGSYANLYGGSGGYWEDRGYEWYAGI
jgi:DMSO/TMAO reductase YedYZ molybdopterin-dependent catalytic subunit